MKLGYWVIGLLGYWVILASTANAAALSLAIDPPIIVINAIPPTNITSSLNIQNKSDASITLSIQLKSFKAKGENGELAYSKETSGIFKNIQILDANVPIENITLSPQQQKALSLSINIPPDTNISDHYFSVVFVSTNSSPVKSNSSVNQLGIATNVLLSVGAAETPKATLEEFSSNIFFEKGPVPFTVRIKNAGAHFVTPTGQITIKNMFGQNVGKLDLTSAHVLSDSIRAIPNSIYMQELRLKDNSDTKTNNPYDFKRPIALWQESFLLGLYTATLNISMSAQGPTFTKSTHFFAFPLLALIIIVIIAIASIVIKKRLKFYMNKSRTQV